LTIDVSRVKPAWVPVPPDVVTEMAPLPEPDETTAVRHESVFEVTTAIEPSPNVTAVAFAKCDPMTMTDAPTPCDVGVKEVIVGATPEEPVLPVELVSPVLPVPLVSPVLPVPLVSPDAPVSPLSPEPSPFFSTGASQASPSCTTPAHSTVCFEKPPSTHPPVCSTSPRMIPLRSTRGSRLSTLFRPVERTKVAIL
jgi:hypothetical protein